MKKYSVTLFTAYWDGHNFLENDFLRQCNMRKKYVHGEIVDCEEEEGVKLSTKLGVKLLPYVIVKKGNETVFRGTFKNINQFFQDTFDTK